MRIEDTDQARTVKGSLENILDGLKWLGLDFDEGPIFQSERLAIYKKYALELVDKNHAYYCFCTEDRLKQVRAEQEAQKLPPKYDRHCINLPADEVQQKLADGENHVIRMRVKSEGETVFDDIIKGSISFKNSTVDDQVLLKSDGFPTYHLASVVDDHEMKISHVIRAEEWLPSTPKHIMLYDYFGWDKPEFAHVPIILGPDKSKLSKRHGAVSLLDYRDQGYLPEAMVNYLAFLGWNPKTDQEIFTREELIAAFDLAKVNKANPIFDIKKLNWMNQQYVQKMSVDDLATAIKNHPIPPPNPLLSTGGGAGTRANELSPTLPPLLRREPEGGHADEVLYKTVKLAQERMEKLTDFESLTSFLFVDKLEYEADILIPKGLDQTQCKTQLQTALDIAEKIGDKDWNEANLRQIYLDYCEQNNVKKGDLLWPLRVAVTGLKNSPDVFAVMDILGKAKTKTRIEEATTKLSSWARLLGGREDPMDTRRISLKQWDCLGREYTPPQWQFFCFVL